MARGDIPSLTANKAISNFRKAVDKVCLECNFTIVMQNSEKCINYNSILIYMLEFK